MSSRTALKHANKLTPYEDYSPLDNGAIAVDLTYDDIIEPYTKHSKIPDYLSLIDHSLQMNKKEYSKVLEAEQAKLNTLVRKLRKQERFLIVVFQGRDGAGKSGATERIIQALDYDMKIFLTVPVGVPTDAEKAHPFLWRFMTGDRMPEFGQVRVFDRSWAERILVEKVMHFTKDRDLERSYGEIRAFEWLLASSGAIIVKFWLDISKEEQLKRFHARAADKPWKLNPSDKVARQHWHAYTAAANEMFYRTGTDFAPWYLVSSEDKQYSRVTILQIINDALKQSL